MSVGPNEILVLPHCVSLILRTLGLASKLAIKLCIQAGTRFGVSLTSIWEINNVTVVQVQSTLVGQLASNGIL